MSFPPRPPMMPHGMPPNIMQQPPYTYSGMPMPPMPMMNMNRPPPNFNQLPPTNKPPPSLAPVTKVFVGNISERAPDSMIRQMLQRCGNVLSWKRVEGTNGKLQAFGFCDFAEPQYTLRCIRLLNGYEIAEKKLLVKVDQKTRELLGEFIKKNRADKAQTKNAKKAAALRNIRGNLIRPPEEGEDEEEDPKMINLESVDEDTLKEDRSTINALELILQQYAKDLNPPEETEENNEEKMEEEKVPTVELPPPETEEQAENKNFKDGIYMKPHLRLEEIKLDEDKKELMTSEISKFRESHKEEELRLKQEEADRQKRREEKDRLERDRQKHIEDHSRSSDRENHSTRDRSDRPSRSDRDRDRDRERERERERERDRDSRPAISRREQHPRSRSRSQQADSRDSPYRVSRRERMPPSIEGNGASYRDNERSRSPERRCKPGDLGNKENLTAEEMEEERERKKLERKLREKEIAYRARLKLWEEREDKKRRQYEVEKNNEMQRCKLILKDAKKLKQFMEDYDDDKDDSTYYKGSSLEKKLKFREKEIESDNRDRQREKEELEELKKRLSEKGFSDVDHEAQRIQDDENLRMKFKFEKLEQSSSSEEDSEEDEKPMEAKSPEVNNHSKFNSQSEIDNNVQINVSNVELRNGQTETKVTSVEEINMKIKGEEYSEDSNSPYAETKVKQEISEGYEVSPGSNSPTFLGMNQDSNDSRVNSTRHVTIKAVSLKKSIQPINQAFADDDEETNGPHFKRAKLISANDTTSGMNSEERKKAVKKLVESIPTDRDELFAYKVDWDQLDENLMEKRIKPWINKKIIEYIGEEEATLHDFICSKIQQRTEPGKLLEEIKVILDDEAELFIKKMWRLIVYETESKRCGISR